MHEQLSSVALGTFTAVFEHHLLLLFFPLSLSLCHTQIIAAQDQTCW